MRLADALGLRYNGANAIEARLNGAIVWTPGTPPPTGLVWEGGWRVIITDGIATADFSAPSDRRAYVYSPPLYKCYTELSVTLDPPNAFLASAGIWDEPDPTDPGLFGGEVGQIPGEQTSGALNDGDSTIFCLTNGADYKAPDAVNSSLFPIVRYGIASDPSVGRLWIRQVWVGGNGGWIGGGDPVAGTGSTNTDALPGDRFRLAAAIPPGGVATIYTPDNHLGSAPAGYTPM